MKHLSARHIAFVLVMATAPSLLAQQPAAPAPRPRNAPAQGMPTAGMPGMAGMHATPGMPAMGMMQHDMPALAGMLLSHTGELKLTDQQVTRLAAIARRADERRRAMRTSMDSMMKSHAGMTPAAMHETMMKGGGAPMDKMHEQERADVRDALAVLTVDQLADAWMMRGAGPAARAATAPRPRR